MVTENPQEHTEEDLVVRRRQGNEEALRDLVCRFKKPVYLLARRLTGDADDAEDIVQETFLKAFDHINSLDPEKGVGAWLYRVAANLASNHVRARKRRWRSLVVFSEIETRSNRGEDFLLQDQVEQSLARLNPALRAAFVLVCLQGLKHAEAGRVLGCSEGTVSWRVFKAREFLRRELGPLFPRDGSGQTEEGGGKP